MAKRLLVLLLLLLVALTLVTPLGCDRQRAADAPEATRADTGTATLEWREALSMTHAEAVDALGDAMRCEPVAQWSVDHRPLYRRMRVEDQRRRWCSVDAAATTAGLDYAVTAIVYNGDVPAVLRMEPRSETKLSGALERLGLPTLPITQRLPAGWHNENEPRERHRAHEVARGTGEVRGIDVYVHDDAPDTIERLEVVAQVPSDLTGLLLGEYGPLPASPELVLPETSGFFTPEELAPYAELRLDGAEIGAAARPIYPPISQPRNNPEPGATLAPGRLAAERAAWSGMLEAHFAEGQKAAELLGRRFEASLTIAAERTLPAVDLVELMAGTPAQPRLRFKVLGRNTGGERATSPTYGAVRASNLTYADAAPRDGLSLIIEPEGFALRVDGQPVPAIDGCPEGGPTVCRQQLVEAAPVLEEVRRLQRAGKFAESEEALRPLIDSYDWAGLYTTLVALRGEDSDEIAVAVADPKAPVAVLARVLKVSAYRRRAAQAAEGSCATTFADDHALWASQPCVEDGSPRSLFELQTIVGVTEGR